MWLNDCFSKKNKFLYKMKCLNTRNREYDEEEVEYDKTERYK